MTPAPKKGTPEYSTARNSRRNARKKATKRVREINVQRAKKGK